ncbi:MAG: multidrug effflux MFS transporter [Gammaproteobacteria bacterium]|nr:multidrug effflux MFS transporter [Gammaproteobacteria bacterium]
MYLIILLGALSALPPLSIDIGLPGFSALAASLSVPSSMAALTLSFFLAGFSIAQFIFGPLADAWGRKSVLLIGCTLFMLGGFACGFAHSMPVLLLWRFIEGAGASSGVVVSLAIVRDLYEGSAAKQMLSHVAMVNAIAPAIAPSLGGLILLFANWRAIYFALGLCGLFLLTAVFFGLRETLKDHHKRTLQPSEIIAGYRRVFFNRDCMMYSIMSAFSFGAMFAYVSGSSFVFIDLLKVSTTTYGLLFACTALGIMSGSFINARLNALGVSHHRILRAALSIALITALTVLVLSATDYFKLLIVMPILILNTMMYGLIAPNATYIAIHSLPEVAGMASAAIGGFRIFGGVISSAMVAYFYHGESSIAMASVMTCFAFMALTLYFFISAHEKKVQ